MGDKTFRLEDRAASIKKDSGNCTCGAYVTSRPNYHSDYCDVNNKIDDSSSFFYLIDDNGNLVKIS